MKAFAISGYPERTWHSAQLSFCGLRTEKAMEQIRLIVQNNMYRKYRNSHTHREHSLPMIPNERANKLCQTVYKPQANCIDHSTLQPLYNTVRYNMDFDITRFKDGPQKCINYFEK